MGYARTFLDPRGRVGRGPLWEIAVIRTVFGVGFITFTASDVSWYDWYALVMSAVFFWPSHVALPLKRLRDLGRTWRTWAAYWSCQLIVWAVVLLRAMSATDTPWIKLLPPARSAFSVADVPGPLVLLVIFGAVLNLIYGAILFLMPGDKAVTAPARHAYA